MVRALYGLKGDVSAWAAAIQKFMKYLGFQPCMADSDVWMISAVETSDFESSYASLSRYSKNNENLLIHVDAFLVSHW